MGNSSSSSRRRQSLNANRHRPSNGQQQRRSLPSQTSFRIGDNYQSIGEVQQALRRAGLESSNLILGVDFTKSNEWTGKLTFMGKCLHDSSSGGNPYEAAFGSIARTLRDFDDDNLIHCYGFGDKQTNDRNVFSFLPDDLRCNGLDSIIHSYHSIIPNVEMSGPTSFAPIINRAIDIVNRKGGYHILVIIADGQVTRSVDTAPGQYSHQEAETVKSIVMASFFPLSIILVGVGDGPWDTMKQFDDHLPSRQFDNFQFVNYHDIATNFTGEQRDAQFALRALMEVPEQYKTVKRLGYLDRYPGQFYPVNINPPLPHIPSPLQPPQPIVQSINPTIIQPNVIPSGTIDSSPMQPTLNEISCPKCTFLNPWGAHVCSLCGSSMNSSSVAPPSSMTTSAAAGSSLPPIPNQNPESFIPAPPIEESIQMHTNIGQLQSQDNIKHQQLQQELDNIKEGQMCPICLDAKKNLVFGCGHQTCEPCGKDLTMCPICRKEITTRIRTFTS